MNFLRINVAARSRASETLSAEAVIAILFDWCVVDGMAMAFLAITHAPARWADVGTAAVILVAATLSSVPGFAFAALAGIGSPS